MSHIAMLKVRLFGNFSVQRDEQALPGFELRKVRELFGYLILNWNRAHSRDSLAELLWPDNNPTQSKKLLRQTLWQLQTALNVQPESKIIIVESDRIQFNPEADVWVDVIEFEKTYARFQGLAGRDQQAEQIRILDEVVQLYRGALLENWYPDWCLYERERLHNTYLALLDKLMDYYEAQQDYETSIIYGLRILCHERTRERTHRRLMRLYYLAGDRASALRQYERCVLALEEELGVKPSRGTIQLYKQIFSDQLSETETLPPLESPLINSVEKTPVPDVLNYLKTLQSSITELQKQLQQSITNPETTVKD